MSEWNVIHENFHAKHSVLTAPDEHMPYRRWRPDCLRVTVPAPQLTANPRLYSSIHTGVYHGFCSGLKTRRNTGKLCSRPSAGNADGKRGLGPQTSVRPQVPQRLRRLLKVYDCWDARRSFRCTCILTLVGQLPSTCSFAFVRIQNLYCLCV